MRDLWRADIRLFGDQDKCVCRFEYEADARDFFFELLNRVRGTDYKLSSVELMCKEDDHVLEYATAIVASPACTSGPWRLVVQRVRSEDPPTISLGRSYDWIDAHFPELF